MKSKLLVGMCSLMLAFLVILTGCDGDALSGDYTFEFKVNYWDTSMINRGAVTQIEFINGSTSDSQVLETKTISLEEDEMSPVYRVSGFSNKDGEGRIFGVKATFEDKSTIFKWSSATKDGDKILVQVSSYYYMWLFSDGNW